MWCTRLASAATPPRESVPSWWMVCPILPFFWFVIFIVAESAVKRMASGELRGRTLPSLKNPMSLTVNCFVRVVRIHCVPRFVRRGCVYSPTRSKHQLSPCFSSKNTKMLKRVNRRVVGIGGDVTFDDGYSIVWAWRWRQNVSVGIQAKIPACFIIRAFPFESQLEPFLCLSLFRVDCIL